MTLVQTEKKQHGWKGSSNLLFYLYLNDKDVET